MFRDEKDGNQPAIRDFTMEKYEEICKALLRTGYRFFSISDYLDKSESDPEKIVLLRHDVDRKEKNAHMMAEIECSLGIRSTYYFRYPYTFKPDIISSIHCLGHEIGYHYETLSKVRGNHQKAITLFEKELATFRNLAVECSTNKSGKCQIKTICMHGSPLSRYDNRDLWKRYNYQDYGITGEAYITMAGFDFLYLTDTGRTWDNRFSVRDSMPGNRSDTFSIETTDDLIKLIDTNKRARLYLTVHPERWAMSEGEWFFWSIFDIMINTSKRLIVSGRNL